MSNANRSHLPYLDGLRACAILLVLWVHFPFIENSRLSHGFWTVGQAIRGGYIGVDLFFVLSGFLITRLLLAERVRTGTISLRMFYARRTLRIVPIYYLSVVFCMLVLGLHAPVSLSLLTYTYNYWAPFHPHPMPLEQTWSLSVEEQFYLVWPFLIARLPLRTGTRVTGLLIPALALGLALLVASSFSSVVGADLVYKSGFTRMLSLSLGGFLAFRELEGRPLGDRTCCTLFGVGLLLLLLDSAARTTGFAYEGGYYWCVALTGYALIATSSLALLNGSTAAFVGVFRRALGSRLLGGIGRVSYGIYVYHVVILYVLGVEQSQVGRTGVSAFAFVEAVSLTALVAMLSWHLIENPLLGLKSRLRPSAAWTRSSSDSIPAQVS